MKNDYIALSIVENSNLYPIKLLGKGGFASVYLCKPKNNYDDLFAVKVINYKQDDKHKKNELNANKKIDSPYIAKFHFSIKFNHNLILVNTFFY